MGIIGTLSVGIFGTKNPFFYEKLLFRFPKPEADPARNGDTFEVTKVRRNIRRSRRVLIFL